MEEKDSVTIARGLYEAFNRRELSKVADHTSPDGKWVNMATGQVFRGPEGALDSLREWLVPFPDASVEITHQLASGDSVVSELTARGTHSGVLATAGGLIPATGRHVSLRLCEVLRLKNGKIMNARLYYDAATLMQQLGVHVGGKGESQS